MAYDYKGQVIRRGNGNIRATKALQQMLADAGYSPGEVDGKFGAKTEAALRKFQLNNGLDPDMIAGQETWAQLERSAPQPMSNPRRYVARDTATPEGEPHSRGSTQEAPILEDYPDYGLPPSQDEWDRDMGNGPPAGQAGVNVGASAPVPAAAIQPLPVGAGPGPESSSVSDEAAPSFSPDTSALPTNGGFDPSSPLSALRARQFIADALAQRNAPPRQRGPSPFDALGGKMPMGIGDGAFNQPGAPVPSPNGMPSWLMDLYGK